MLARVTRSWVFVAAFAGAAWAGGAPPFTVSFDAAACTEPYSGRVYIVMSKSGRGEPKDELGNWFRPPPMFAQDAAGVPVGGSVTVDGGSLWFPVKLADVPDGTYAVQAVARVNPDCPSPGRGAGDLYSEVVTVTVGPQPGEPVTLLLSKTVEARPFAESERVRLFEMVSPALSAFHGREMKIRAGVSLPGNWTDQPGSSYPVVYSITGFGGDHRAVRGAGRLRPEGMTVDPIIVVPDPLCYRGHSVFADSANNGPWGRALTEELIPALEAKFHGAGAAHRYLTGGSSGGWSSLWLQVTYPERFRSVWSHVPDPVDFRDFQRIDLYKAGANMYVDEKGDRRPLARSGDRVTLWYDDFVRMESLVGPGGQIHSFEAVFSPRGADGLPRLLFDRATGAVDKDVAHTWEAYDIRLVLERNWATLGPKLAGKLHIYAGEVDTFYLDGAARLLKESLEKLGSDAQVVIAPGMAHQMYQPGNEAMFRAIAADWAAARPASGR